MPSAAPSPSWTILSLVRWTAGYLADKGIADARLDAELLLADSLGLKRLDLYLQHDRPLSPEELAQFRVALRRRAHREPLQYIAGQAAFRQLRLSVDRRVLIPRPETEVLVDHVLARCGGTTALSVLEIGTGSGAIAISLATERSGFDPVVATDVSPDALEVAKGNATAAGAVIEFREGSLFEPVAGERFHVIVSNPPYVGERERQELEPEVVRWEPHEALFSGVDGLGIIRRIIAEAPTHLHQGGLLALEIGASQAGAVRALVLESGDYATVEVQPDLAGRDRIVLAVRA